ncbi:hypothetical protein NLI96_g11565 [Meripilus lineatus]|uniref:LysM domain-containing protein n=1 Tax=Meripilus lineatus TaxID=2056292 RepID=A0AAD5Y8C0_9APHY|nr:hypothetical protein NLI96_g11565 [Physisporinus lineatus]
MPPSESSPREIQSMSAVPWGCAGYVFAIGDDREDDDTEESGDIQVSDAKDTVDHAQPSSSSTQHDNEDVLFSSEHDEAEQSTDNPRKEAEGSFAPSKYYIKPGDTLLGIALRFGIDVLTKEVDWRVAKAYVALADVDPNVDGEAELEYESKKNGKEDKPSRDNSRDAETLEGRAIDRYLDDDEWEQREIREGRGVSIPKFPLSPDPRVNSASQHDRGLFSWWKRRS